MSQETLRKQLEAQGTFPEEPDVRRNFEILFALAREKAESVDDLAWGFLFALDQWSHVGALDPEVALHLGEWAMTNWSFEPYERCKRLISLLASAPAPETAAFLKARREECGNETLRSALERVIARLPAA
ncbi:MAG TPA: hypothetical protein VGM81_03180 [Burkholderiaceae bacterium]|jgi:hypothetical protein